MAGEFCNVNVGWSKDSLFTISTWLSWSGSQTSTKE